MSQSDEELGRAWWDRWVGRLNEAALYREIGDMLRSRDEGKVSVDNLVTGAGRLAARA